MWIDEGSHRTDSNFQTADFKHTPAHSAAENTPELCQNLKPSKQQRAWGMPGAGRHPQPRVGKNKNHTSAVTARTTGSPGIPAREWF
jgi:hypothetical protein